MKRFSHSILTFMLSLTVVACGEESAEELLITVEGEPVHIGVMQHGFTIGHGTYHSPFTTASGQRYYDPEAATDPDARPGRELRVPLDGDEPFLVTAYCAGDEGCTSMVIAHGRGGKLWDLQLASPATPRQVMTSTLAQGLEGPFDTFEEGKDAL